MITVYITTSDENGVYRKFSLHYMPLEVAFDLLNNLVNNGYSLIEAHYLNKSHKAISLPIEAFGGEPMSQELEQLEQEWKAILN